MSMFQPGNAAPSDDSGFGYVRDKNTLQTSSARIPFMHSDHIVLHNATCDEIETGIAIINGTLSCGTNAITCGNIVSSGNYSGTAGTMTIGTNALTAGAIHAAAITSSSTYSGTAGNMTIGTNSLTAGAIISSRTYSGTAGNMTIGTNSLTVGAIISSSTYSGTAGTMTLGTNALTAGYVSTVLLNPYRTATSAADAQLLSTDGFVWYTPGTNAWTASMLSAYSSSGNLGRTLVLGMGGQDATNGKLTLGILGSDRINGATEMVLTSAAAVAAICTYMAPNVIRAFTSA